MGGQKSLNPSCWRLVAARSCFEAATTRDCSSVTNEVTEENQQSELDEERSGSGFSPTSPISKSGSFWGSFLQECRIILGPEFTGTLIWRTAPISMKKIHRLKSSDIRVKHNLRMLPHSRVCKAVDKKPRLSGLGYEDEDSGFSL